MRDHFDSLTLPADELSAIRAEIQRLKAREAVLRRFFLDSGDSVIDGRRARVVIKPQTRRSFDHSRLPDTIRNDRRYWKITQTQTVRTIDLPRTGDRPVKAAPEDDEIDLIEPF